MTEACVEFEWWGRTDKGPFRKNNEDAFLLLKITGNEVHFLGKEGSSSLDDGELIVAVSDGMGGANAGEFASRTAVEKITELLSKNSTNSSSTTSLSRKDLLLKVVGMIHTEMLEIGRHYEECRGMGATLSIAWFSRDNKVTFCHVGDSRIYHFSSGTQAGQLTEDHTHVGWLLRSGKINEREARSHRGRSLLQQALGGKHKQIKPQVGEVNYQKGDRWLFCTDGLIEGVWDRTIERYVKDPPLHLKQVNPVKRLMDEALSVPVRDNLTAVVLHTD